MAYSLCTPGERESPLRWLAMLKQVSDCQELTVGRHGLRLSYSITAKVSSSTA